jgi:nucleotide-binding universal stress UspA family protein
VAEVAAEISAEAGVTHTFERSRSAPAEAILSAASALADGSEPGSGPLIVVGRSGHGAHRLLGSVPTDLLAHSSFPVLAIP